MRRRWWTSHWLLVGIVGAVVAIVAVLFVVGTSATSTPITTGAASSGGLAPRSVVDAATHPDLTALATAGVATGSARIVRLPTTTPPLTAGTHPLVVYVGADYCPFCAARRWSLVVALSRFGDFSNLGLASSSGTDIYPNTSSFSFHGSSYTSRWLSFAGVETETTDHQPLDTPTAAVAGLLAQLDVPPYTTQANSIPFLDIGGRYVSIGAGFSPALLQGMSAEQIAAVIRDPASPVGQAVMADANAITAALCDATGGQPSSVCGAAPIAQGVAALNGR